MILEEQVAKTKLCQETFQAVATADRIYHEPWTCVGSGCMAWRWKWDDVSGARISVTHGYCGKAGKP